MHLMFSIQHVLISQPTNTPKSENCLLRIIFWMRNWPARRFHQDRVLPRLDQVRDRHALNTYLQLMSIFQEKI